MGGTGTLKFALCHPEKFAGAAVLSSAPRYYEEDFEKENAVRRARMQNLFDIHGGFEGMLASDDNIWRLAEEKAGDPALPKFYFSIGEDDPGFERFDRFRRHAGEIGFKAV